MFSNEESNKYKKSNESIREEFEEYPHPAGSSTHHFPGNACTSKYAVDDADNSADYAPDEVWEYMPQQSHANYQSPQNTSGESFATEKYSSFENQSNSLIHPQSSGTTFIHHTTARSTSTSGDISASDSSSIKKKLDSPDKTSPTKPKRPLSAYNLFFREERARILAPDPKTNELKHSSAESPPSLENKGSNKDFKIDNNPDKNVQSNETTLPKKKRGRPRGSNYKPRPVPHGKVHFNELGKKIGKRWRTLNPSDKAIYCLKAAEEKAIYDEKKRNYLESQVLADKEKQKAYTEQLSSSRSNCEIARDDEKEATAEGYKLHTYDESGSPPSQMLLSSETNHTAHNPYYEEISPNCSTQQHHDDNMVTSPESSQNNMLQPNPMYHYNPVHRQYAPIPPPKMVPFNSTAQPSNYPPAQPPIYSQAPYYNSFPPALQHARYMQSSSPPSHYTSNTPILSPPLDPYSSESRNLSFSPAHPHIHQPETSYNYMIQDSNDPQYMQSLPPPVQYTSDAPIPSRTSTPSPYS
eukprot:CAMPEP_0194320530 /NCGR_PEP_ID=MMETSP0171-20130528/16835_1 /TAXON_ID=218684 /ORGANISM="Corethron pennatum, Strain L29A3" /LENGTH=523 /DNA_ID=CAMNT_0039078089 /DNA_START=208 /DNA_END=1776 /DNA_ORIENTATION=-